MRRIKATVFAIVAIIVVLFINAQAGEMGVPWQFGLVTAFIVGVLVVSLFFAWLRG